MYETLWNWVSYYLNWHFWLLAACLVIFIILGLLIERLDLKSTEDWEDFDRDL